MLFHDGQVCGTKGILERVVQSKKIIWDAGLK